MKRSRFPALVEQSVQFLGIKHLKKGKQNAHEESSKETQEVQEAGIEQVPHDVAWCQ